MPNSCFITAKEAREALKGIPDNDCVLFQHHNIIPAGTEYKQVIIFANNAVDFNMLKKWLFCVGEKIVATSDEKSKIQDLFYYYPEPTGRIIAKEDY